MKRLLLREDDENMFDSPAIESDHGVFWKNSKYVYIMIDTQPVGFWIQFVTTFRAHMFKKGYVAWMDDRLIYAEKAFISMHDMLTEKNVKQRNCRVSQVFQDVKLLELSYKKTKIQPAFAGSVFSPGTWQHSLSSPQAQSALRRLFGTTEQVAKTSRAFLLWSRFVGALIVCFKRWRKAKVTSDPRSVPWTPPVHWRNRSKRHRAISFELHLKTKWETSMGRLIGMQATSIIWLHNLDRAALEEGLGQLPRYCGTQLEAFNAASPYPWDDDADQEFQALIKRKMPVLQEDEREFLLVPYTEPAPKSRPEPQSRVPPQNSRRTVGEALEEMMLRDFVRIMFLRSFSRFCYSPYGAYTSHFDSADELDIHSCANCSVPEPKPGYYKACKQCKDEHVRAPKYYCGRQCQVEDWKKFHKRDHKEN